MNLSPRFPFAANAADYGLRKRKLAQARSPGEAESTCWMIATQQRLIAPVKPRVKQ
jgi:hypothetical protein